MDRETFLQESIDYIKSEYKRVENIQNIINEIYDLFHSICKKHDIPYFLAFGSLIGQVRDGGIIPWDPDMDLCMHVSRISELCEVLDKELPAEYFYESNFTSNEFPFFQMRIGKKGYPIKYVHLDIFYLIACPDNMEISKFRKKVRNLYNIRLEWSKCQYKYNEVKAQSYFIYILKKFRYRIHSKFMSIKSINKKFIRLITPGDYDTSPFLVTVSENALEFPRNDIEPMTYKIINGKEIGVPNNIENFLNRCYKNYREYLPIDARFHELYAWDSEYKIATGINQDYKYNRN